MSQATAALVVDDDRLTRLLCRIASSSDYHCLIQTPSLWLERVVSAPEPELVVLALEGNEDFMLTVLDKVYQSWGDRRLVLLGSPGPGPGPEAQMKRAQATGFSDIHPITLPSGLKQLQQLFAERPFPVVKPPDQIYPQHQHKEE